MRLQNMTTADVTSAATGYRSLPDHRHHQQHQQSLDQPLDLSVKSNKNNKNNVSGSKSNVWSSSTPSCPNINPFTSGFIAYDMVNKLSDLTLGASTFLPHQQLGVPKLTASNQNVFKSKTVRQPRHKAVRKFYTKDEQQKTLQDIQSGNSGTRRETVIHRTPRSTLRNKVYNIALERDNEDGVGTGTVRDALVGGEDPCKGPAIELLPLLTEQDDDKNRGTASAVKDDFSDNYRHHLQQVPHHQQPQQYRGQQPMMPPPYMTVEDFLPIKAQQQQQKTATVTAMSNAEIGRMFLHYADFKLPQIGSEPHYLGHSIPVDSRSTLPQSATAARFSLPTTADCRKRVSTSKKKPTTAAVPLSADGASSSSTLSNSAAVPVASAVAKRKGTRSKRGKYLNYDKDSMLKAVLAVKQGEKNVHEARVYYGVPLSTLEYKVKKGLLTRRKTRKPKNLPSASLISTMVAADQPNRKKSSSSSSVMQLADKTTIPPLRPTVGHDTSHQTARARSVSGATTTVTALNVRRLVPPFVPAVDPCPLHVQVDFQGLPAEFSPMTIIQRIHTAVTDAVAKQGNDALEVA